jgi:hypothetical protein
VGSITEFEQFQKTIREKNIGLEGNVRASVVRVRMRALVHATHCADVVASPGFVIRFENGEMYKIKTAWYCDLNKTLDLISRSRSQHGSEMDVWKVILEGAFASACDDLPPPSRCSGRTYLWLR